MVERVALCAELLFLAELSAEDVREKKVSVYKVLVFTVLALIYRAFTNQLFWMEMIINLVPGGIMILLAILTKEGIGYGDSWMILNLGLFLGIWRLLISLGIAFSAAAAAAGVGLALKKWNRKTRIPFYPFLVVGYVGALLW